MKKFDMVEIFKSIQGEGTCAGYITTFIRFFGCNLNCVWCDTHYSRESENKIQLSVDEIVERVVEYGAKYICLTGGEPLLNKDNIFELIQALQKVDFIKDIHIETNGSIDLKEFDIFRMKICSDFKVRFIMDYKLPDSGMNSKMNIDNFEILGEDDEIKFVVASEQDFNHAIEMLKMKPTKAKVLFSPVFGSIECSKLVELMIQYQSREKDKNPKLSLQLHKFIWDINERGV